MGLFFKNICLVIFIPVCISFNLKVSQIYRHQDSSSLFGYSVALQTNPSRVFVGAPKARSKLKEHFYIDKPGTVFSCSVDLQQCDETSLDIEGEVVHNSTDQFAYLDRKEDSWIGGNINIKDGKILVCAPRWKNQYRKDYYLMNGVCYILLSSGKTQKLLPLLNKDLQGVNVGNEELYNYAYGQAGFSAEITEEGDLVLGAPGLMHWRGSVIKYPATTSSYSYATPIIPDLLSYKITEQDGYFGYAVVCGRFVQNKASTCAASAPRSSIYKGSVTVFTIVENRLEILIHVHGVQMGEYFGASLAAADVNNDGFDELLVGAPLHTLVKQGEKFSEEGVVYVFSEDFTNPIILKGDSKFGSRFGSAITNLGDVNQDGFQDIAVGAPYEQGANGFSGAVYIYLGSAQGLQLRPSQKISADALDQGPVRGFGIGLSKGVDVDKNGYPDLAVGAHESSHAVLLKSKSVVYYFLNISSDVPIVNQNTSQFMLNLCFTHFGKMLPSKIHIDGILLVDKKHRRGFFAGDFLHKKNITIISEIDNPRCVELTVNLTPVSSWSITALYAAFPIQFSINTHNLPAETMFDPDQPKTASLTLPVLSNCNGKICIPRWKPQISLDFGPVFTLGSKHTGNVVIEIGNEGDDAHIQAVVVAIFPHVSFQMVSPGCHKNENDSLICLAGAHSRRHSKRSVTINLNLNSLLLNTTEIRINVSVYSYDIDEIATVEKVVLVIRKSLIAIGGRGSPEIALMQNLPSVFPITHAYQIYCGGYTPIDAVEMQIQVPFEIRYRNVWLPLLNDSSTPPVNFETVSGGVVCQTEKSRVRREDNKKLFCHSDSVRCLTVNCKSGPLPLEGELRIDVKPNLLINSLEIILGKAESIFFNTSVTVWASGEDKERVVKSLSTRFDGEIQQKTDPFLWLYILIAVVVAISLLLLIAYILWRWKFFNRKSPYDEYENRLEVDATSGTDSD